MALNFKGTVAALPTENIRVNDAYYVTGTGYRYCSALSSATPPVATWTSYAPIKIIDDLALSTVYEGNGTPANSTNAVQFPDKVDTGTFYLDGSTGDVWAYVSGTQAGWIKW